MQEPKPKAPKEEPVPEVNRPDLALRYQLMLIDSFRGVQKAYIKDLLKGTANLVKVGETIGDCQVMEILPKEQIVRLKPSDGPEFTIQRTKPAK